jgi:aspartate racemase
MNQSKGELTVGVLGGMGPYATLGFLQCILDYTPAKKDWDHIHTITDNNPQIPSRTRAFLFGEADPVPMMIESANCLRESGADFVVLPCNSAHYFLPRVQQETDVPFIDMIEETSKAVLSEKVNVVGVLAGEVTAQGGLYEARLESHGVSVLQVTDAEQMLVRDIIEDAKQNKIDEATYKKMTGLIDVLVGRGAEAVILGCTEFPLVMGGVTAQCPIIDSMSVLAKAVIRRATSGAPQYTGASEASTA